MLVDELLPAPRPTVSPFIRASAFTSSFAAGVMVPIPTLPLLNTRSLSVLFVRIAKACASVVPIKLVAGSVLALPVSAQSCAAACATHFVPSLIFNL